MSKIFDTWTPIEMILLVFTVMGMTGMLMWVHQQDYRDELIEFNYYCSMVSYWKETEHLPFEQRGGWPDYKGVYETRCVNGE